jgi:uncharacterized protein YkwD
MKTTKQLLILLLLITQITQSALASFNDVAKDHKNYDAIIYLQENGIINGYEDGTFNPDKSVNRAEFIKIILEGTNIELDKKEATLPFSDIDENSWYEPYIKKAYAEGWIVGYTDGTFKPEQTINKAEALKILGEVQDWTDTEAEEMPYKDTPKLAWYTKYVSYGKSKGFLEESGENFYPEQLMTRANISEIIYRTLTTENERIEESDEIDQNDEETYEEINFTPITLGTISSSFFDYIKLDNSLPNTFYKNEVYVIEGKITSGGYDKASVIIGPYGENNFTTYTGEVENDKFSIPIHFREQGNYQIGILPGESGSTTVETISILPNIPDSKNTETLETSATSIKINYENDSTFVESSTPENTFKILYFKQNNETVKYFSRQDIDKITVKYSDFELFDEDKVYYYIKTAKITSENPLEISSNFTISELNSFTATEHTFDSILEESINTEIPDLKLSVEKISFSGTVKTDTQQLAYVIKPNGSVEEVELSTSDSLSTYLNNPIIPENGGFNFEYTPSSKGRYIIEIVDKDGLPTINHPIYVGGMIPIIPDYFDLNTRTYFTNGFDLTTLKMELLKEINMSREEFGLKEVIISNELNTLAQNHSDDMAENNYFGHVNLYNETPEDRRKSLGITTPVSENIARDISIGFAHFGLMRSATHRKNILTEEWERVGLGITLKDGYLFITEEFSTNEL